MRRRPERAKRGLVLFGDHAAIAVGVVVGQQHPGNARQDGGGVHHAPGDVGAVRPERRRVGLRLGDAALGEAALGEGLGVQVVEASLDADAVVQAQPVDARRQVGRELGLRREGWPGGSLPACVVAVRGTVTSSSTGVRKR